MRQRYKNTYSVGILVILASLFLFGVIFAAAPAGDDWFQLLVSPSTGADNTGDGGTGNPADYNYYYVGQSALQQIQISSGGAEAANIWVDFDPTTVTLSNLTTGTFFPSWSGQTIGATRLQSTGFDLSVLRSGTGSFGTFDVTFLKPTAAAYGTASPSGFDINIGVVGETTESNIALAGADILDDAEDFSFHVWADTVKPYAENFSPLSGATSVAVNSPLTFDLRDTLNGEGDATGVGTGVNTATPAGVIMLDDGSGAVDLTPYDSYSCSGIWGTNLCEVTVAAPGVSGITGDTRRFEYNTTYTLTVSGFTDNAASSQDQLGDANGPNTMDTKVITFTTEGDTVAPQVVAEIPTRASLTATADTNITIDVHDRATYPNGPSGSGVNPATCSFNVSSTSVSPATYQQGDAGVAVTAINYGYRFTIDPASNFAEGELVSVSAYDCADTEGNVMTTDNWTFTVGDTQAPYVDTIVPTPDTSIALDGTISFHIKDDGSGVDLSNLVVYVNGVYYTLGGGPVSVTTTGTRITAGSSLDLAGGNYAGDTTGVSGTSSDYAIVIDPQTNFTAGESIPVIIYAQDADGNLMERVVVGFVAGSVGVCTDGSAFCGPSTSWNGAQCVGTGSSSRNSGSTLLNIPLEIHSMQVAQVNESTILVSFFTNKQATTWVVYDDQEHSSLFEAPLFGYENRTTERATNLLYHSFVITDLQPGMLYRLRPVAQAGEAPVLGAELLMAPVFATRVVEVPVESDTRDAMVTPAPDEETSDGIDETDDLQIPDAPTESGAAPQVVSVGSQELTNGIRVVQLQIADEAQIVRGVGEPGAMVRIAVHNPDGSTQTYTVQVNEAGVWEIAHIWKTEGVAAVTVYDAAADAVSDGLAVMVQAPRAEQSLQEAQDGRDVTLPAALFGLFALLSGLAVYVEYLASQAATCATQLGRERAQRRIRVVRTALIVGVMVVVIGALIIFWADQRTGVIQRYFEKLPEAQVAANPFMYEGFVRPVLEASFAQSLYITHNERSLRFDDAAPYAFSHVVAGDVLRFTHPQLPLPVLYRVDERAMRDDVVFDAGLYAAVYQALRDTVRAAGIGRVPTKELVLTQARQVSGAAVPAAAQGQPVYLLTVAHENEAYDYYFIRSDDAWRLLLP